MPLAVFSRHKSAFSRSNPETGSEAKAGIRKWMTFYNYQRPHSALGGRPSAVVYLLGKDHIVGALVITVTVAAFAPVVRLGRFLNTLLGIVLLFAPLVAGAGWGALAFSALCGLVLIALSIPRGTVGGSFGTWDRFIR